MIHGFIQNLNDQLNLEIEPTDFKGDIHLSESEKAMPSQVEEIMGESLPYWIVSAGGKFDYTIKWWDVMRYQRVVDHFRGKILFVQVGKSGHYHPPLSGVLDLRGKTDLRQLVRLVHHAQGVLCPVTLLMHLAAAVEARPGMPANRACVVVAGGREPAQWEAYPHHQFIHVNGMLKCCAQGGCWRARTFPLGDGDALDKPDNLCVDVIMHKNGQRHRLEGEWATKKASAVEDARYLPHCMDMISAEEVIRRIELYFCGGNILYLSRFPERLTELASGGELKPGTHAVKPKDSPARAKPKEGGAVQAANPKKAQGEEARPEPSVIDSLLGYQHRFEECASGRHVYPVRRFQGRGIVICGGGAKYFPGAWVVINILRRLGCNLPIELWHLGPQEMTERMLKIVAPLGVACIDGERVRKRHPARRLGGWELKPFAILHSAFQEVLYLDSDNVPVRNPEFLFDSKAFQKTGAIFWPDIWRLAPHRLIWSVLGIEYRDEREFESGQIVIDKRRCWKALQLAMHLNEYSDFYYQHFLGDKETFHLAWMKLAQPYGMPARNAELKVGTLYQYDLEGNLLFQHRNGDKWRLNPRNEKIAGFLLEDECLSYLDSLEFLMDKASERVRRWAPAGRTARELEAAKTLIESNHMYHRRGYDHRLIGFHSNGRIRFGGGRREVFWDVFEDDGQLCAELSSLEEPTCRLQWDPDGVWRGHFLVAEQMPVEMIRQPEKIGTEPLTRIRRLPVPSEAGDAGIVVNGHKPVQPNAITQAFRDSFPRVIHIVDTQARIDECGGEALRKQWLAKHPGWECRIWTESNGAELAETKAAGMDAHGAGAWDADWMRLAVAHLHGGLCVSADAVCLKNIDPLFSMVVTDVFAGFAPPSPIYATPVGQTVIGALPGSKFLKSVLEAFEESSNPGNFDHYQNSVPLCNSASRRLTETAAETFEVTVFPLHIFHPEASEYALGFVRHEEAAPVTERVAALA